MKHGSSPPTLSPWKEWPSHRYNHSTSPTGFNGYRKDSVEQYVNGLETQIWNLQRQLTEKNMVLDKRQSELGKREQEAESLRQQIERLNADLQDARQASENPMQELGTSSAKNSKR